VLRHIVMFRFDPSASEADRQAGADALAALKGAVPEIRTLAVGLDSADDFPGYRDSLAHMEAWTGKVQPFVTEMASIQFVDES
jgi:hypothetical protein